MHAGKEGEVVAVGHSVPTSEVRGGPKGRGAYNLSVFLSLRGCLFVHTCLQGPSAERTAATKMEQYE